MTTASARRVSTSTQERIAGAIRKLIRTELRYGQKYRVAMAAGVRPEQFSRQLAGEDGLQLAVVLAAIPFLPEIVREALLCTLDPGRQFRLEGF